METAENCHHKNSLARKKDFLQRLFYARKRIFPRFWENLSGIIIMVRIDFQTKSLFVSLKRFKSDAQC